MGGRLILIKNNYAKYKLTLSACDRKETPEVFKEKFDQDTDFLLYEDNKKFYAYGKHSEDGIKELEVTGYVSKMLPKGLNITTFNDHREPLLMKVLAIFRQYQHFYVSDHGSIDDIISDIQYCLVQFNSENNEESKGIVRFGLYYKKLSDIEKIQLKQDFLAMLTDDLLKDSDKLQLLLIIQSLPKHLRLKALELGKVPLSVEIGNREIGAQGIFPQKKFPPNYDAIFENTIERFRFITFSLTERFVNQAIEKAQSPFFTQLRNVMHKEDANLFITHSILVDLAIDISKGEHEPLIRPVQSYGERDKGDTYHKFARSIDIYFKKPDCLTEKQLAYEMRRVLAGEIIGHETPSFLPNLIGSWFVAEIARNSNSMLSGLMLLDLIESGKELLDEKGNNWYRWTNTVVHPLKETGAKKVEDLYGKKLNIDDFGGSHPMAYNGSVNDSKEPLLPGERLPVVRQKEGSLLIHWLFESIKSHHPKYQIKVVMAKDEKPPEKPQYDEITEVKSNPELKKIISDIEKIEKDLFYSKALDSEKNKGRKEALTKLKERRARINKTIELKQQLKETIIIPLLRKRVSTLVNLLCPSFTYADKKCDLNLSQARLVNVLGSWNKKETIDQFKSLLNSEEIDVAIEASLTQAAIDESRKEQKVALEKCAAKYGYECHDVKGDGNCFFYALVDQLKRIGRTGQELDPDILRMLAAIEIDSNTAYYQPFIPDQDALSYAENTAKQYTWVGMVVAHAIAKLKNIIIVIIPNDGTPQVIKPPYATEIIVLGNELDTHFQSLTPLSSLQLLAGRATPQIQTLIDESSDAEIQSAPIKIAPKAVFWGDKRLLVCSFAVSSTTTITFYQREMIIEGEFDGEKISSNNIYVNVDDDPTKTSALINHEIDWQINILKNIKEISLAFQNTIVITRLSDWSFAQRQATGKM